MLLSKCNIIVRLTVISCRFRETPGKRDHDGGMPITGQV